MDNYQEVLHQMQAFGVEFQPKDLPLVIDAPKRRGCGAKGKWWYWLRTFRPEAGGCFIVGRFGSYKTSESCKVEVNWKPLGEAERARMQAERAAALQRADALKQAESELAALSAADLWHHAHRTGHSPYIERKKVQPEACRYLPDGTLVLPLLRYDVPRAEALRAVQRILPNGRKLFTKGFVKPGCALRLGDPPEEDHLLLVCEGYATGLSLRMATGHTVTTFVALDAGNLGHVVPLLRELYPQPHILVCADDDWKTTDRTTGQPNNPGRTAAKAIARKVPRCDLLWPVFNPATRDTKDTDFNDLHLREGLPTVARQLRAVMTAMGLKRAA